MSALPVVPIGGVGTVGLFLDWARRRVREMRYWQRESRKHSVTRQRSPAAIMRDVRAARASLARLPRTAGWQ